jgi:hypothetical protein
VCVTRCHIKLHQHQLLKIEEKFLNFFVPGLALRTLALCSDGTYIFTQFVASRTLIMWGWGVLAYKYFTELILAHYAKDTHRDTKLARGNENF